MTEAFLSSHYNYQLASNLSRFLLLPSILQSWWLFIAAITWSVFISIQSTNGNTVYYHNFIPFHMAWSMGPTPSGKSSTNHKDLPRVDQTNQLIKTTKQSFNRSKIRSESTKTCTVLTRGPCHGAKGWRRRGRWKHVAIYRSCAAFRTPICRCCYCCCCYCCYCCCQCRRRRWLRVRCSEQNPDPWAGASALPPSALDWPSWRLCKSAIPEFEQFKLVFSWHLITRTG